MNAAEAVKLPWRKGKLHGDESGLQKQAKMPLNQVGFHTSEQREAEISVLVFIPFSHLSDIWVKKLQIGFVLSVSFCEAKCGGVARICRFTPDPT